LAQKVVKMVKEVSGRRLLRGTKGRDGKKLHGGVTVSII